MNLNMKNFLLSILLTLSVLPGIANDYNITGYFTFVYVREHKLDMPRGYYMLINGNITPMWFFRYSSKSSGEYSNQNFDPRKYLGKTISMDFTGTPIKNNNEYVIEKEGKLVLIPKVMVTNVRSIVEAANPITVAAKYMHPQTDTLSMPHDHPVAEQPYTDKTSHATVKLKDYVKGNGTEASPYISADGSGGLLDAIKALPNGGTLEVESGVYRVTSSRIDIPRFINIKGTGDEKPVIELEQQNTLRILGSNTIENICIDVRRNVRDYSHYMISIVDNARDVIVKNCHFVGGYNVAKGTYDETGRAVLFRMFSHHKNIRFENNTFTNVFKSLESKGMRNQHGVYITNNLFEGQSYMCMSFDQTSDMDDLVIENNTFKEFPHFGVAFARINGVKLRHNVFYSRNLLAPETYNHAIHIEEHSQNFIIEDNTIDVIFRNKGNSVPNSTIRSTGLSIKDSRFITVKNNVIKNSEVIFASSQDNHAGYSLFEDNNLENGSIQIIEACREIIIRKNKIVSPPEYAFLLKSTLAREAPFGWHTITGNEITGLDGKQVFSAEGEMHDITFSNNLFLGSNQKASMLNLSSGSEDFIIQGNKFRGVEADDAFLVSGSLNGIDLESYKNQNDFSKSLVIKY